METVVLVIHLLIAVSLVGVILIQKSEGGGLGIGGGGGLGGMMTARGTANLLTRITGILAGMFMLTSIILAIMAGHHNAPISLIEQTAPTNLPAAPALPVVPAEPAKPSVPSAPVAQ
ncbi:MAG: preprotein translocase subunit SecG [Rhodospirillaceae bacterium]